MIYTRFNAAVEIIRYIGMDTGRTGFGQEVYGEWVRLARACGLSPFEAQLLIDLTCAPETVQQRVNKGEIALSAWREMRPRPRAVQEQIAEMEKPTMRAIRSLNKPENDGGLLLGHQMLENGSENTLIADARALQIKIAGTSLDEYERGRLLAIIQQMALTLESR